MQNDKLDKRTIKLMSVANQLINEHIDAQLTEAYKAVRLAILDAGEPANSRQLAKLEAEIIKSYKAASIPHLENLTSDLYEISALEAGFMITVSNEAIKAESLAVKVSATAKSKVESYVKRSVMHLHSKSGDKVGLWDEFVTNYTTTATDKVLSVVRGAWLSQTTGAIPSTKSVIEQVRIINDNINRNNAETLVRTAVNHFSTQGRLAFRDDNLDVIDREVPIVTFDSRVSDICLSISANYGQKGWPVGESPVGYNPYHFNCRTVIGFLLAGQKELYGTRQSVQSKSGKEAEDAFKDKQARNIAKAEKADALGQERKGSIVVKYSGKNDKAFKGQAIPANTPIAKFLREQEPWYIEEVLGKKRAEAFLAGDLNLGNLTDKMLKPKTLQQLGID